MTRSLPCGLAVVLAGVVLSGAQPPRATGPTNQLTAAEQSDRLRQGSGGQAGWRLLFDGTTTKGWRGFKKPAFPTSGWIVEAGRLKHLATAGTGTPGGGDIITVDTFNDFDLRFQWIVAPGANSGVKYLVTEERSGPIAHEYQVIDDARHADAKLGLHRTTAALYDVIAPPAGKPLKPAGEINDGRIMVNGTHVEHWLNGVKVLEYELGSAALKAAKAQSKFKDEAGWGEKLKGHILLQDHGDDVSFFNIRIRELPAATSRR